MPRAVGTLITPRPRAPQPMPKPAHLRQFGLEIAEEAPKPASVSTRRSLLAALTGAAFAGTALAIAAPPSAQPDMPVCRDMWEAALLASFRTLNPHEKEAALTMAQALADRRPVLLAGMPATPDAALIAACERFSYLDQETGRLLPLVDWLPDHVPSPADLAQQGVLDRVSEEQHDIGDWLAEQAPQTEAGRQVKARAILAYGGHSTADMISRLTLSLVQDVAGEQGA